MGPSLSLQQVVVLLASALSTAGHLPFLPACPDPPPCPAPALPHPQLMHKTKVPCALVTAMDRHTTDALLHRLGLRNYFCCTVTGAVGCGAREAAPMAGRAALPPLTRTRPCRCYALCLPLCPWRTPTRTLPTPTLALAADDDMETVSQRYLSAAIKLARPPNACVVFAACPTSVTGAQGAGRGVGPSAAA